MTADADEFGGYRVMIAESHVSVDESIERFVHGAKALHVGYYLDSRPMERRGLKMISQAVKAIDLASPTGRDPLLPLLEQKDEGVRTVAAAALWQSHPRRAIAVLRAVDLHGITEASTLAMSILMFRGRLNPCPADLRHGNLRDETEPMHRHLDLEFRRSVLDGQTVTDVTVDKTVSMA